MRGLLWFGIDGFTANASVWTRKEFFLCVCVCVCVHMHTLHTVSYSVDRVSIHSRFTGTASIPHIWPPQTVEIS